MRKRPWVWVDFESTPQVLFFEPLIRRLIADGYRVRLTAKPQAQTQSMAAARGLQATPIGSGDFRGLAAKVAGNAARSLSLARWALSCGVPGLLLSSSRSAALAACVIGVRSVGFIDYEHAAHGLIALVSRRMWLPDLLRNARLPRLTRRVAAFYDGLKENLYLDTWLGDRCATRTSMSIGNNEFLVVTRPPAESAHYASEASSRVWLFAVSRLAERADAHVLVMPRDQRQTDQLSTLFRRYERVRVMRTTVDGPALVEAADLVIGGGGTMNREAAVLGTPVWSTFSGPRPHVDACLAAEGRLRWVLSEKDVETALSCGFQRKPRRGPYPHGIAAISEDLPHHISKHGNA